MTAGHVADPPPSDQIYDEASDTTYYFNQVTQESRWTKPALLDWDDVGFYGADGAAEG